MLGEILAQIFMLTWILLIDSLFYLKACIICNVFEFLLGTKAPGFKVCTSIEAGDGVTLLLIGWIRQGCLCAWKQIPL